MNKAFEINFDGLVGLTHNYSGLSYGNIASIENEDSISNPLLAALQGVEKMKFLYDKGIKQAILPPQERPHIPTLRLLGFSGSDSHVIKEAFIKMPRLLTEVSSAASMWAANSATITPSSDSSDNKVHITPANLFTKFHRSLETKTTSKVLEKIFNDNTLFTHHAPLPSTPYFADEGAANHTRFCKMHGQVGVHFFVYGKEAFNQTKKNPLTFPARQTLEASYAISRLHSLKNNQFFFAQQNPLSIDAGVFHNDVISVGNKNLFFYHEKAFVNEELVIHEIKEKVLNICSIDMVFLRVKESDISIQEAVRSYLFNSQLITLPNNSTILIAPVECKKNVKIKDYLEALVRSKTNSITEVFYLNLHQSMKNGGGPACLRLRAVLTEKEYNALHKGVIFDTILYQKLTHWIKKHYRDRLKVSDLADPKLLDESYRALDELTKILNLGSLYHFQQL